MRSKKLLVIPMLLIMITINGTPAFSKGQTKIIMPDSGVQLNISSLIKDNRTLIPLMDVSQNFKIDIERDVGYKSFTCKRGNRFIKFNVDEKIANVDGKNIRIDSPPRNIDGIIYVPMRSLLENLNYSLEWDGVNNSIKISEDADKNTKPSQSNELLPSKYIAHAGGRINGHRLTNSKEAIEQSYRRGYDLIELDMEWSTDGNLVLVHDWGNFALFINSAQEKSYSAQEFRSLKMKGNLTPLTIDDLADWLKANYGVYIVTDIKTSNVQALKFIKDKYPDLLDRFIPQIYNFDEYEQVKNMGYENIIMTMYMSNYSQKEIIDFVKNNKLFAVTMPVLTAKSGLPLLLEKEGIFVYTHTVNTKAEEDDLIKRSVNGFYTDDLLP